MKARAGDFDRFGIHPDSLFRPERPGYLGICKTIEAKSAIKTILESAPRAPAHPHRPLRGPRSLVEGCPGRLRPTPIRTKRGGERRKKDAEVRHDCSPPSKTSWFP